MKLTIGMAHFDDFDGAVFTIQSLALHHGLGSDAEIIVIDNSPETAAGKALERHITGWSERGGVNVRYIPMGDIGGTTQPRERIFREARGEIVMVMDCHVLLVSGGVRRMIDWFDANPDSGDIVSGPLLYNDLRQVSTHFADEWRGEMWGTWATDSRGLDPDAEPFEIPGQGLGLFACRRDRWLGFNEHFRGFGGEEMYIHEKFRRADRRAMCLPFLRWWHRFERPGGVRYQLTRENKIRNYVLGHQELGLPLDRVHEHFVSSGLFPQDQWDQLVENAIAWEPPQKPVVALPANANLDTLDLLFAKYKARPRDLDQHAEQIRNLSAASGKVVAFVKRVEWNIFLAAGRPRSLIVHQLESDQTLLAALHNVIGQEQTAAGEERTYTTHIGSDSLTAEPVECDLLVIDTVHHADRLYAELERHGPLAKRILLRGTAAFGEQAEGGGLGLWHGFRRWQQEHPEWHRSWQAEHQYGLALLSRDPADYDLDQLPGEQLLRLLRDELGVTNPPGCTCKTMARKMDAWGVSGCREHRDEILATMKENQERWGWKDKLSTSAAAAIRAVFSGLAFRLNPLDVFGSLIDEALRRAENYDTEWKAKNGNSAVHSAAA